ncbi:hypothetical protein B0J14DRAFT_579344 [Halenospora varia]|nr:hypothetical protein B0J14DRAFT_579344 [Halenospora varia]
MENTTALQEAFGNLAVSTSHTIPVLKTFTYFSRLPLELRLQTWFMATLLEPPRIVSFSPVPHGQYIPGLIHTCRDSRWTALKRYRCYQSHDQSTFFFDFEKDYLYLNYDEPWPATAPILGMLNETPIVDRFGEDFEFWRVKRAAIAAERHSRDWDWKTVAEDGQPLWFSLLRVFPSMETLGMILNETGSLKLSKLVEWPEQSFLEEVERMHYEVHKGLLLMRNRGEVGRDLVDFFDWFRERHNLLGSDLMSSKLRWFRYEV